LEEAIPLFQAVIRLASSPPGLGVEDLAIAHDNLGIALGMQGKWEEALPAFQEAVRLKPRSARSQANLGQALCVNGRPGEAGDAFREALRLAPNDPIMINNYARYLATCPEAEFRDASQAVRLAQKAIELKPKSGGYWNTLGAAHYLAGHWPEAVAALEKAGQLRRGDSATDGFFLAMAHWQLGHKDEAGSYFHKAVAWMDKHQPKNEELRRFRAEAAALLGIADNPKDSDKGKPAETADDQTGA
jgi:tetratricopeptide (TPR) repeat protein